MISRQFRFTLFFMNRLIRPIFDRTFWTLTILGNIGIFLFAVVFWWAERASQGQELTLFDSLWWAYATVTTVGHGPIIPVTEVGKLLDILLMLGGAGLFAFYTAIFANAIMGQEISALDRDVRKIHRTMAEETRRLETEERSVLEDLRRLRATIEDLERKINS